MENNKLILKIARELGLDEAENNKQFDKQLLAGKINELIQNDFERLVSILYRVDVNETKLKQVLQNNPGTDAGLIIADLMIERQEEKARSRSQFRQPDTDIDEEEKW